MKKYLRTLMFIFYLIILNSCNDNDKFATINEKEKFRLDKLEYQIGKGIAPNHNLGNYLKYNLKYHFEFEPGTLQTLAFIFPDSSGMVINTDYAGPTPINEITSTVDSIWINQILEKDDSLKVICKIEGVFWQKVGKSYKFTDTFLIQNEQMVVY
jgi:hypothetical protein